MTESGRCNLGNTRTRSGVDSEADAKRAAAPFQGHERRWNGAAVVQTDSQTSRESMSKQGSPKSTKPHTRKKPAPKSAPWRQFLANNSETIALIALIGIGLLAVDLVRRSGESTGIMRQLFGWAALPALIVLLLLCVAILLRQAAGRFGLGQAIPWGQLGEMLAGLSIVFLAGVGLSHLWGTGVDPLNEALAGRGGGLVGWLIGSMPAALLGDLVTTILLIVLAGLGGWIAVRSLGWLSPDWHELQDRLRGALQSLLPDDEPTEEELPAQKPPEAPPRAAKPSRRSQSPELERPSIAGDAPATPVRPRPRAAAPKPRPIKAQPRPDHLPPLDLLARDSGKLAGTVDIEYKKQIIEQTLTSFGVPAKVVEVNVGPTVTQFGVMPGVVSRRGTGGEEVQRRVRVSRIKALSNDLALALEAPSIRIEAPVPGKGYVGIEVPNQATDRVTLRAVLESQEFLRVKAPLTIALGRDVAGMPVAADLAAMPHLLIAGATGSGKSVCIHSILSSLLFNNGPDVLRLLLVDPKRVELPDYNGVPHLLAPVVTDADQVVGALTWLALQMDERYRNFARVGARSIKDYNRKVDRKSRPAEWQDLEPYPSIVFVIDELADLMLAAPEKVEHYICRLAQMARATGIHLILATQRPSVDVVTGLIKANFPARIAFSVTSQIDSRVIIDTPGAEKLLGSGDMLFMRPDSAKLDRLQGCFVSDKEIGSLVRFWKDAMPPEPLAANTPRFPWTGLLAEMADQDELYDRALELVQGQDHVSTSWLQRRLKVSYHRAAELIERMEADGYVGSDEGGGRGREVLIASDNDSADDWLS